MSAQDYKDLCNEDTTLEDVEDKRVKEVAKEAASNLSAKEFIMNRTKEHIDVTVLGPDGEMNIQIKARLTKGEAKKHIKLFGIFDKINTKVGKISLITDTEEGRLKIAKLEEDINTLSEESEEPLAAFLASITIDDELNKDFWASEDIDANIASDLFNAYILKASEVHKGIQKFRN